ncbi:hypothetical protein HID58_006910 [Brassica napus]|uniref:Uncharacterized protein n=1 Tax=Brassica napus TaxID=3708 RepID=A0ABQ7X7N1_BRANA|nr:hypothetical protein HID58_090264 [Brassica napus]KAH0939449.1 hypothetical protein HID58_006910 [Brassica napus]
MESIADRWIRNEAKKRRKEGLAFALILRQGSRDDNQHEDASFPVHHQDASFALWSERRRTSVGLAGPRASAGEEWVGGGGVSREVVASPGPAGSSEIRALDPLLGMPRISNWSLKGAKKLGIRWIGMLTRLSKPTKVNAFKWNAKQ